ncbi:MAG: hemolysin family protein [Oscillospiraceae bacterium]|nr:hemolysin family protein [Oscillospiraceae bacterium]
METDDLSAEGIKPKPRPFFRAPLMGLNKLTGRLLGGDEKRITKSELLSMVDEDSAEIITNTFEFDDLEASDVMTHRINVVGVSIEAKLDDIIYVALDKGFSRLPVYRENLDHIIGIIIVKDFLSLIGKNNEELSEFSLENFVREAIYIPESCACTKLFRTLKEKKAGMAIVVDEHGGTAGIITMEDIVEEIMGSILDEYDKDEVEFKQIDENKYQIDGEADPEDALKLFGHELPENHEYETMAGFVTDLLGFIPEQAKIDNGQRPRVDYKDLHFIVAAMEDNCISRIIAFKRIADEVKKRGSK